MLFAEVVTVKFPEGDGGGDGDIERVLGAALRDFDAEVGAIDYRLVDAVYFVAYDEGVFLAGLGGEIGQTDTTVDELETSYSVAFGPEGGNGVGGGREIAPDNRLFGSESRLMYFGRGRCGRNAA